MAFVFWDDDFVVLEAFELFVAAIVNEEDGKGDGDEGRAKVGAYFGQHSCIDSES